MIAFLLLAFSLSDITEQRIKDIEALNVLHFAIQVPAQEDGQTDEEYENQIERQHTKLMSSVPKFAWDSLVSILPFTEDTIEEAKSKTNDLLENLAKNDENTDIVKEAKEKAAKGYLKAKEDYEKMLERRANEFTNRRVHRTPETPPNTPANFEDDADIADIKSPFEV